MSEAQRNFHIMFIDESRIEKEKHTFVIGLIIPADGIIRTCGRVNRIIKKYIGKEYSFLDGSVNLKLLRQTKRVESPFAKLKSTQRFRLTQEIYETLHPVECTLVCSIVEEKEKYSEAIKQGLYFILERFFYFLDENDSSGMVISDRPVSETYDYMKELIELVRSTEYWERKFQERIYQDIFFTRDEWDPLIQITDLVAFNISAYVRYCLRTMTLTELSQEYDFRYKLKKNRFFKMILPLIRTAPNGNILGYGIKCW